jgi:predicted transcriptional regulator
MAPTATFTVRVPVELKRRLDQLAKAAERSRSWLAADALQHYVDDQQWQLEEIEAGVQDADAGRVVSHDQVNRWLKSWGHKRKLRPPTCK